MSNCLFDLIWLVLTYGIWVKSVDDIYQYLVFVPILPKYFLLFSAERNPMDMTRPQTRSWPIIID